MSPNTTELFLVNASIIARKSEDSPRRPYLNVFVKIGILFYSMAAFLARAFCIPKAKSFSFLIDGIHFSECRLFCLNLKGVLFMDNDNKKLPTFKRVTQW